MKVLVVDDTTFIRMTIIKMLEENNHTIVGEACDGEDACNKYMILRPDLVIMDISMPIMNGIDAVKKITAFDSNAVILICSLQGQRSNVMEAIRAGAKSFVIKPIKPEKLLMEISKLEKFIPSEMQDQKAIDPIKAIATNLMKAPPRERSDFEKGIEEGYLEARREIATNMIRMGLSLETITGCVELSEEDIDSYKTNYNL